MRQAETGTLTATRGIIRILLGVLIVLFVVMFAFAARLERFQRLFNDPAALFAGDSALQSAARSLETAETEIAARPDDEPAHFSRARAYIEFGNLEGAALEWERWRESGGEDWGEIARRLDELRLKTDEIRALLEDAESSPFPSEKYPPIYTLLDDIAEGFEGIPHYRALFLKGYLLLREGRRAEAEPIFGEELENYVPLRDYVMYNHARSLIVTGSEKDALEEFQRFLHEYPSSRLAPLAHLERINLLRDLGRLNEAVDECGRVIDRYPTSAFAAKTLRKWAEIYETQLDFDNGAAMRVRILRDFPDSEEASDTVDMFIGGVYAPQLLSEEDRLEVAYAAIDSHTSDALGLLTELAESENLTPEQRATASQGAARCEYSYERYYECIEWAERARSLAPGTETADRAGIRIGHAYWRLNKKDLGRQAYWEVIRGRGPLAASAAQVLWGRAYEDRDLGTVEDACRYVVEEYPSSDETPAAMTMLANLGCHSGQYQTAKGYAERCIEAFPNHPVATEAAFWLAEALEGLGRNADARDTLTALAQKCPWSYWGIRAREIARPDEEALAAVDPFDFDIERVSVYDGALGVAWELYDAGTLDLAESEFVHARDDGIAGAMSGLALVYVERSLMHSGIVTLRQAADTGDQAWMTPSRQQKLLDVLYPRPFENEIRTAALAHDIPPSWLWGAMRQESSFDPRANSRSGARGLMQIMPETGRFIAAQRGAATFDPNTLWDPSLNIDYGAWYFFYLRNELGGDRLLDILAAYNGGPGSVRRWRGELPARDTDIFISAIPKEETRNFARWVYANIRMYEAILEARNYQLVPF